MTRAALNRRAPRSPRWTVLCGLLRRFTIASEVVRCWRPAASAVREARGGSMDTYDVVVVGGGISGGLPAAAYLQKAGLKVALVEARPELGNFFPTHETWPQTLDSPHASINFSGNSPAIEDLELESRYGYRIRTSPVVLGTAHPDGTNCLICYDPERTAENFARHSERDGETVLQIQTRVLEKMVEMNELAFYSPHPDVGKFEQILRLCGYVMGRSVEELSSMTAYELIELTFEADRVRQTFICPVALHLQGAPRARGHPLRPRGVPGGADRGPARSYLERGGPGHARPRRRADARRLRLTARGQDEALEDGRARLNRDVLADRRRDAVGLGRLRPAGYQGP